MYLWKFFAKKYEKSVSVWNAKNVQEVNICSFFPNFFVILYIFANHFREMQKLFPWKCENKNFLFNPSCRCFNCADITTKREKPLLSLGLGFMNESPVDDSSKKKKRGRIKKQLWTPRDTPVPIHPLDISGKNKRGRRKKPLEISDISSAAVSTTTGLFKILSNDMGGGVWVVSFDRPLIRQYFRRL